MKLFLATILCLGFSLSATAADIEAGKAASGTCGACHGPAGMSSNSEWPNLAGQQEAYLANQLRAFKSGDRKNPLMSPMASGLSDIDIDNLAAYYSSLK